MPHAHEVGPTEALLEKEKSDYVAQIEDSFNRTRRSEKDLEQAKDEILGLFAKYTEKENDYKNLEEARNQLER
ncbi:hypothetical protein PsorP6_007615 [Peronosclerospora sorghi]|uniref:Uncharacterized protein n=1 Tax=Peronosclerospora sorghi TaxID=230839 RepID=A0ACC0WBZ7_9STRA|nr:hypothetical protein PsorP6_007615 [Peronosclerospora sorghi]